MVEGIQGFGEGGSRRVPCVEKVISVAVWTTGCSSTALRGPGSTVILSLLDGFGQKEFVVVVHPCVIVFNLFLFPQLLIISHLQDFSVLRLKLTSALSGNPLSVVARPIQNCRDR